MSKPWGTGAWAADAEQEDKQKAADPQTFPSLKDAVSTKQKKKTKMSLQEFTMQPTNTTGLTPTEMLRLPTGPKERSPDELQQNNNSNNNSWGGNRRSYSGFDEDRRAPPQNRVSDVDQISRADEVDNWGSTKKPMSNRFTSVGGGNSEGGFSRADEVDNWALGKKPVQVQPRYSGFRDLGNNGVVERPRLVLDPRRSDGDGNVVEVVKTTKASPFGEARPREEILAEKGLDWKKMDLEIEGKTSRPTSSHSSRPTSSSSTRSEGVEGGVRPTKPKVNPFGDAKPREVLLQEKGLDWRKIDLESDHRRVQRQGTEAEKNLKDEIEHLKRELEKVSASNANRESLEGPPSEEQTSLHDQILGKERDLELLVRELDDKVRFGQKGIERPGSGAGWGERPSSRSGSVEESRSIEFMERPRSRGTGDAWTRPGDDRRAFPGGRERGFLGNRDSDRPRSRDRW